jgi:hypothetical protein
MAATIHDLETERARRMGRRQATTAVIQDGLLHVTFPAPVERLELTAAKARFWRDMFDNFLPALEAEEERAARAEQDGAR